MAYRISTHLVLVIPLLCLFSGVIRADEIPPGSVVQDAPPDVVPAAPAEAIPQVPASPAEAAPYEAPPAIPAAPSEAAPAEAPAEAAPVVAPAAAAADATPLFMNAEVPQVTYETKYQKKALEVHNDHRQHHHVAPLELRDDLNARAVKCAEYYAEHHILDHSCPENGDEGENLWSYTKVKITDIQAAEIATNAWYAEEFKHNWNEDWQPASSHFTQVVWKNTSHIGFGVARSAKRVYGCALYSPHGNVKSKFKDNVFEHED